MSYRLKQFANAQVLQQIDFELLLKFLTPHRDYLQMKRGMPWREEQEQFAYHHLAGVLISPDEQTPSDLLDAIFFIDEIASDETFDLLKQQAETAGVKIPDDISAASLAVLVWLEAPNVLERIHAQSLLTQRKRFETYYCPTDAKSPNISSTALANLEAELNDWFVTRKKGRGTRVFAFDRDDETWFLVRHGERMKREGAIDGQGESTCVLYRPEAFDVLIYRKPEGELLINAKYKGERQVYCQTFGKHCFGDESFFCYSDDTRRFTLQPIVEQGQRCLVCSDTPGIEAVELAELQFEYQGRKRPFRQIFKSGACVLETLQELGQPLPIEPKPIRAGFRILFSDSQKWRTICVCSPNVTIYDRESDSRLIDQWLTQRGFSIQREEESCHDEQEELLAVA